MWTAAEVSRLRRLYPRSSMPELLVALPSRDATQIKFKARHLKLRRARPPLKPAGFELVDAIKQRAVELNYTMRDIDALACCAPYFYKAGWIGKKRLNYSAINQAVEALGGRLVVVWD